VQITAGLYAWLDTPLFVLFVESRFYCQAVSYGRAIFFAKCRLCPGSVDLESFFLFFG